MVQFDDIKHFFPLELVRNTNSYKYMIKEYVLVLALNFLFTSKWAKYLCFIGGTNLRLIKGIDRFSEDLDFDCTNLSENDFREMSNDVLEYLQKDGWNVEIRNGNQERLKAFRTNIYFPQLLFELGLSGHKEERFLIKLEAQDQGVEYRSKTAFINRCGYFFPVVVPEDDVLCAMKLCAMLQRSKGRDFYDAMFLLNLTQPNYEFMRLRVGVSSKNELKEAVSSLLETVNLQQKQKDFEHLLFHPNKSQQILYFKEFVNSL